MRTCKRFKVTTEETAKIVFRVMLENRPIRPALLAYKVKKVLSPDALPSSLGDSTHASDQHLVTLIFDCLELLCREGKVGWYDSSAKNPTLSGKIFYVTVRYYNQNKE